MAFLIRSCCAQARQEALFALRNPLKAAAEWMGLGLNLEYEYVGLYNPKPLLETVQGAEGSQVVEASGAAPTRPRPRTFTAAIGGAFYGLKQVFLRRLEDGSFRPQDVVVVNVGHDLSDKTVRVTAPSPPSDDSAVLDGIPEGRNLQEYTAVLEEFLDFYQAESDRLPVVIWRETTAQHHHGRLAGELTERKEDEAVNRRSLYQCDSVVLEVRRASSVRRVRRLVHIPNDAGAHTRGPERLLRTTRG
eukprot:scaffold2280_cov430-Prasinococcus_capsulatus_cf.AAC.6